MKNPEKIIQIISARSNVRSVVLSIISAAMIIWPSFNTSAQDDSVGFQLTYSIRTGDIEIGTSTRSVVKFEDRLVVVEHSVYVLPMFDEIFGQYFSYQRSRLRLDGTEVMPLSFEIADTSGDLLSGAEFDGIDGNIKFIDGTTVELPDHKVFDWESWYVWLAIARYEEDSLEGQYVTIVEHPDRVRTYVYGDLVTVEVTVAGEPTEGYMFTMQDVNDSGDRYEVWFTSPDDAFPSRIDKWEDQRVISFALETLEPIYQ